MSQLVSLMSAKFTAVSERSVVIALYFSFVHRLLSNILSVHYSTWTSYVNITLSQKYSGNGGTCKQSIPDHFSPPTRPGSRLLATVPHSVRFKPNHFRGRSQLQKSK